MPEVNAFLTLPEETAYFSLFFTAQSESTCLWPRLSPPQGSEIPENCNLLYYIHILAHELDVCISVDWKHAYFEGKLLVQTYYVDLIKLTCTRLLTIQPQYFFIIVLHETEASADVMIFQDTSSL